MAKTLVMGSLVRRRHSDADKGVFFRGDEQGHGKGEAEVGVGLDDVVGHGNNKEFTVALGCGTRLQGEFNRGDGSLGFRLLDDRGCQQFGTTSVTCAEWRSGFLAGDDVRPARR